MKSKNSAFLYLGLIAIVILSVVGAYFGGAFNIFGGNSPRNPMIAEYAATWCAPCNTGVFDPSPIRLSPGNNIFSNKILQYNLQCGGRSYVPNDCTYKIDREDELPWRRIAVYVCDPSIQRSRVEEELKKEVEYLGTGAQIDGCIKYPYTEFQSVDTVRTIKVNQDDVFYIATQVQLYLDYSYQPFCLFTQRSGRVDTFATCSKSVLVNNAQYVPSSGVPEMVPRGQENAIQNIVWGYKQMALVSDVVEYNGEYVFLRRLGQTIQACEIKQGKDKTWFVDEFDCKSHSDLICIPSMSPSGESCVGGTQLVKIEKGRECTTSGETFLDGKLWDVICVDGIITDIRNPRDIIGKDLGQGANQNRPIIIRDETNISVLLIWFAGVFTIILLMIVIKIRTSKKR